MANKPKRSDRVQPSNDEALVRYFQPIVRRFLRLASPAAFRSEQAMRETFGFNSFDDGSGAVKAAA